MSLKSELDAAYSTLTAITGSPEVVVRATMPPNATLDVTEPHIILDLIPGAPGVFLQGGYEQPLLLQIGVWHPTTLTAALVMAENAAVALAADGYVMSSGIDFQRDEDFHGVIFTMRLNAAFGSLN